jgi:PAS domain S-box-containing protein
MPGHVLIVEDEDVLRLTFATFLEDSGYSVKTAEGFRDAMALLEAEPFDVVVTDIILAGKTGIDLLRCVNQMGLNCQVIMITGEPNVETAAEAVRLGAFDYLAKPVTGHDLRRVVRLALDKKRVADERDKYAARMDMYRRELEAIFNSVQEGIVSVDENLRVRQINAAAAEWLGVQNVDVAGRSAQEVLGKYLQDGCEALRKTLATHTAVAEFRVETHFPGRGDRVVVVSTMPLLDEHRYQRGAILLIRDVTRLTVLERELEDRSHYQRMIGKSPKMREIFELLENLAETDSTVLVVGESGTGKELVASALHHASPRRDGPFVKVNCAALAEELLESELFGHVKGAFTGAVRDRVGRFELANGGTILLDEIGDISPRLQLRLLRVLQEREFERVGDSRPIRVDVRIIASTNQDLVQKIQQGLFREDLYYRLNVIRIELPPLRERLEDIPLLVDHLCRRFNTQFHKEILGVAPETLEILMRYPWPGNIRELENCMERAFIVCHDSMILPKHLPREVVESRPPLGLPRTTGLRPSARHDAENGNEKARIQEVLEKTDWNIAKSARLLGVARNTLYQRIRLYDLKRPTM